MVEWNVVEKLMKCFPRSFINSEGEFIAHQYANEYFILRNCETEREVKRKVISWFSRGAYKTEPYRTKKKNDELHNFMLNGINKYLGTNFTHEDMEIIYTYFGNDCNKELCEKFIDHNYDMQIIYDYMRGI